MHAPAFAATVLPSQGRFVAGQGSITTAGDQQTIDQSSSRAIIDWGDFSIGRGGAVAINNGSGATLNRVTGANRSQIDGALTATGSVYLINPNGVVIGKSGVVNTGGSFVASTLDVTNSAFLAGGGLTFSGDSTASVANLGKVSSLGGDVALVAATVSNQGVIAAANGGVGLLAGGTVLIDDSAHDFGGLFSVAYGDAATSAANGGTIQAANVALLAQAGNVYALAGNTAGTIDATGVKTGDGHVMLISEGGATRLAGTIEAQGAGGAAGAIETSGHVLDIGSASVNAHGGAWLLDPYDLTVDATAAGAINTALGQNTSVTLLANTLGASGPGNISSGAGDITIDAALTWNTAATLTLVATHDLIINAPITIAGGGKAALGAGEDLSFGLTGGGFAGSLTFASGQSGQDLSINGSTYTLLYSMSDLAGINGSSDHYALAGDLGASGQSYGASLIGGFNGTLEGLGHTISNLVVSGGAGVSGGLIGVSNATIRDIGLNNADVSFSAQIIGGLVGEMDGGAIRNTYVTGSVSGHDETGGLVGSQYSGTINNSFTSIAASGYSSVGGLVGSMTGGSVDGSFATGQVNGHYFAGGLVGYTRGAISNSFSTAAVTASGATVGGLVGWLDGGAISNSFATGAVNGSRSGGLTSSFSTGMVTNSYWDTQTTGQASSTGGGVGLTTAQMQDGASASGLGGAFTLTSGLYPYLTSVFPNGVQVVEGVATAGALPLAGAAVTVDASGNLFATASTGANGYYYAFAPAGAMAAGGSADVLTYLSGGAGATLSYVTSVSGAGVVATNDVVTGTLTGPTSATTLSALGSGLSGFVGEFTSASDGSSAASSAIDGATGYALTATAFDFNTPASFSSSLSVTTTSGDITVSAPIVMTGGASLGLNSAAGLSIGAPINAVGGDAVNLNWNTTTSDLSFGLSSNGFAGALNFAGGQSGQSLTINGAAYTLLYSLSDLAGINGSSGYYALASDQDASGQSYGGSLIGSFNGTLEGLGHSISNLAVSGGTGIGGLIGAANAIIRDIGLDNAAVSPSGAIVGGLIGEMDGGAIRNTYVTGSVSGGDYTGGLVGAQTGGSISNSFAAVTVSGNANVGGLVGQMGRGSIDGSFTTGQVNAHYYGGGLAGYAYGTISNSFSTATVTASGADAGGLVGWLDSRTISNSFATGMVSGGGAGGLTGSDSTGTVINSYWDTQTTGQASSTGGGVGLTTAQMQDGASASGLGGAFTLTSGLYPYLTSVFPNGVQVVKGVATAGALPLAGAAVTVDASGSLFATASTGANGYYYAFAPADTVSGSANVLAYLSGGTGAAIAGLTSTPSSGIIATDNLIKGGLYETTGASTLSGAVAPTIAGFLGASDNSSAAQSAIDGATSAYLVASGDFTVDTGFTSTLPLSISTTAGDLTLAAPIVSTGSASSLVLGAGGRIVLESDLTTAGDQTFQAPVLLAGDATLGGHAITFGSTLDGAHSLVVDASAAAAFDGDVGGSTALTSLDATAATLVIAAPIDTGAGGLTLAQSQGALTLDTALSSSGSITLANSGGGVTLSSGGSVASSGGPVLLAANGAFVNGSSAGAGALSAGPGRYWTVYTQDAADPTGALASNSAGGLVGANWYNDAYDFGAGQFASAVASGNHFVTAYRAVLDITANPATTVYGDADPPLTYVQSGLLPGDTITGALARATGEDANSYAIGQGALSTANNYIINYTGANFTITARPITLTYTASAADSVYGDTPSGLTGGYAITSGDLVNGDTLSGAAAWTTTATSASGVGGYAITGSGLSASGNYALTVDQAAGNASALTITARPITLTYTASAADSVYGDTPSGLTGGYAITSGELVNGDTLAGAAAWTTTATSASGVGGYAITGSGLSASGDYALTVDQAAGNASALTITARPITITYTADSASRVAGLPNPAFTGSVSAVGLVDGDTLASVTGGVVAWVSPATNTSFPGLYAIDGQGLTGVSANYRYSFVQNTANATALTLSLVSTIGITPSATATAQPDDGSSRSPPTTPTPPAAAFPGQYIDASRLRCVDLNGGCSL